ncbi:MAG: ammonium transporter, partial [Paenibacillus sp.]|nr:ammonium transporter [Paenibacillus sp.]
MKRVLMMVGLLVLAFPTLALAAGEPPTNEQLFQAVDAVWIMLAAILVIFMQAGFALLEAGSTRMKNAGHVAGKTILTFGIAGLAFWAVGFGLVFGDGGSWNKIIGFGGFFVNGTEEQATESFGSLAFSVVPIGIKFLFQL